MIALRTRSGQTIRVAEDRVEAWEARGYTRVDQPAAVESEPKKAPAKKSAAKKSTTKSSKK